MRKICINNRDELIMLFVDNIAYIMADGNCTKIKYIGGLQTTLSLGISKVENMLSDAWRQGGVCPFVRLGRSLIVNQMFLYGINLLTQRLTLSDGIGSTISLQVPKQLLKTYKGMIAGAVVKKETKQKT